MSLCSIRQLRISSALDDGRDLSASLRRHVEGCPRCGSFLSNSRAIGEQLGDSAPAAHAPPWMHTRIMARIQTADRPERQNLARPAWLPAAAGVAAIAVLVGLIATYTPDRQDPELVETTTAQIPAPVTPLHPASVPGQFEKRAKQALATEFQNLASDISGARKFLSASLRNTIPALGGE